MHVESLVVFVEIIYGRVFSLWWPQEVIPVLAPGEERSHLSWRGSGFRERRESCLPHSAELNGSMSPRMGIV